MCLILYAFTPIKKIRDDFIKTRSSNFILDKIDIDEDDFDKFKVEYKDSMLNYYELDSYNDKDERIKSKVLMTFSEFNVITDYTEEVFGQVIMNYVERGYEYLRQEYIDVLDLFLYTLYHNIYHAEDDDVEDYTSYNMSYKMTPEGIPYTKILQSLDYLKMFVFVFQDVLK